MGRDGTEWGKGRGGTGRVRRMMRGEGERERGKDKVVLYIES